jgi:hypothetical protein
MYLELFNKERTTHIHEPTLGASPPLFQGFFQVSAMHPDHALRDRGSIVPTLYPCVSRTEALLMASTTSYHKRLHGSHRFVDHILALFAACKRLAILVHDFMCEGSVLLYFI